ncbi:MAG: hypothetical protein J6K23_01685 [Bacilli bacterium]|nr:hypothetical protein [Bacilli bacterium]
MNNSPSIDIAKKIIQKAIINELCKKDVIDFYQYNTIIKNINEDILKLEAKMSEEKEKNNIVVKIPI